MQRAYRHILSRSAREDGQTMVEYTVVLSVITIGIMLAIVTIGDSAGGLIQQVADVLT